MSAVKHTAEPWGQNTEVFISAKAGEKFGPRFIYPFGHSQELCEANARRIVACVNACKGLDTECLERLVSGGGRIATFNDTTTSGHLAEIGSANALEAQRDQLLNALECLFASYRQLADSGDAGSWSLEDTDEGKKAFAAIAAVKGCAA